VSTILQLVAMLLSALWFADRFSLKQETMLQEIQDQRARMERIESKLDRVEKYLSSKDPRYWQTVSELESKGEK
jgi:sensor domain CHASE-containing protein